METSRAVVMAGGCQCGAVRYALFAEPYEAGICHCRMCQKAFGSFFAPFAAVRHGDFAWTRGRPAVFRSSAGAERGFCRDCGTPLSFAYVGGDHISLAIGSLDMPGRVPPTHADGIESRLPWFDMLASLPGRRTEEDFTPQEMEKLRSRQHPDGPAPG